MACGSGSSVVTWRADRSTRSLTSRSAADDGFPSFWLPQIFGVEALAALGIIGREVGGIELGTAVIPSYPRHPVVLAQQALTTQAAAGGRLVLGIGLSHQLVIEGMYGYSYAKPVRHLREYLEVLAPAGARRAGVVHRRDARRARHARREGRHAGAGPCCGPRAEDARAHRTRRRRDGHVDDRARDDRRTRRPDDRGGRALGRRPNGPAGRGRAAGVRHERHRTRRDERGAWNFQMYGQLPSYRAMLDREGAAGPADVAVVGNEEGCAPSWSTSPRSARRTSWPTSSVRVRSAPAPGPSSGRSSDRRPSGQRRRHQDLGQVRAADARAAMVRVVAGPGLARREVGGGVDPGRAHDLHHGRDVVGREAPLPGSAAGRSGSGRDPRTG